MPHTAARAYERRDSVQRRSHRPRHPPSHNRTLVSASEAASGLHTGCQGTDARANLPGSWYYSTHATDTHPRGWVRRAGSPPPCAASFFLYSFFAGEERMEPPEGDSKRAWKKLGCEKPPTTPASKLAPCVVSASAAASGLHTRLDDGCSHKPAWHLVQCAAAAPTPYAGVGS